MKLPILITASLVMLLSSCVPPKGPQTSKSNKSGADSKTPGNSPAPLESGTTPTNGVLPSNGTKPGTEPPENTGGTDNSPMPVPVSNKIVYRPLGLGAGGYQSIKQYVWPDKCVKGDLVRSTGALFPFNEPQTLVVRGPIDLAEIAVFEKKDERWLRNADFKNLQWHQIDFGTIKNFGTYPSQGKILENGRELFSHLPSRGEKIVVVKVKMPMPTTGPYNSASQNNVPAVWMLNSRIFQAPSVQYGCNCRGLGNPGGCGELDIAEVIPENKNEMTTTLYTYEGARGGILKKPRPTSAYQIYAAILRVEGGAGEVAVLEMESFDFKVEEIPDSFVSREWLPAAEPLNKGSEALIPPGR